MAEGTGMLMVDDVYMYMPFLNPLAIAALKKVLCVAVVAQSTNTVPTFWQGMTRFP